MSRRTGLRIIKLVHTAVWAVLASTILALPVLGWRGQFRWANIGGGVVIVEGLVLAFNRWRCPLTGVAARFTDERVDNFDIYLPLWLARHNKQVFGGLFLAGELFVLACWLSR